MSDSHDVPKMVGIYKKLFLVLVSVTAFGIVIALLHVPVWLAVAIGFVFIALKSTMVYDSFKHLMTGRNAIIILFVMTAAFFATLLLLPAWNQNGHLDGTVDISKEIQMQEKPVGAHGAAHGEAHAEGAAAAEGEHHGN